MLRATGLAALVTVAAGLLGVRLFRAGRRRLTAWLTHRVTRAAEIEALRPVGAGAMAGQALWVLSTVVTWVLALVGAYVWLTLVLNRFPYTRPWGQTLRDSIVQGVGGGALAVLGVDPAIFAVAVILFLARRAQQLLALWFEAVQAGRVAIVEAHPDTAPSTRRILSLSCGCSRSCSPTTSCPSGEAPCSRRSPSSSGSSSPLARQGSSTK